MDIVATALARLNAGRPGARHLARDEAQALFGALLDARVGEFETGALLAALRWKRETAAELEGFVAAANARLPEIVLPPGSPRLVVIPSYSRLPAHAGLMPLLAALLARHGVPVLVHGEHSAQRPRGSFEVLDRLGFPTARDLDEAYEHIVTQNMAVLPTHLLAPELARLLALRERMGGSSSAHLAAKFLDPCPHASLRVVCISDAALLERLQPFVEHLPGRLLLMRATEADTYLNPQRRPRIDLVEAGRDVVLFEAEARRAGERAAANDDGLDGVRAAREIAEMLGGTRSIPHPVLNQLAACLYAAGHSPDLNRAKARVALGTPLAANA